MPGMMKNMQKLVSKVDQLQAKFDKLGGSTKADRKKEEVWTCLHCMAEKCYASRTTCFKCGLRPKGREDGSRVQS